MYKKMKKVKSNVNVKWVEKVRPYLVYVFNIEM